MAVATAVPGSTAAAHPILGECLAGLDPAVHGEIAAQLVRQQSSLEMFASGTFAPQAVMQAHASLLTNKHAEGYPGRRYCGGYEHVDAIAQRAINRLTDTIGLDALRARVAVLSRRFLFDPNLAEANL